MDKPSPMYPETNEQMNESETEQASEWVKPSFKDNQLITGNLVVKIMVLNYPKILNLWNDLIHNVHYSLYKLHGDDINELDRQRK